MPSDWLRRLLYALYLGIIKGSKYLGLPLCRNLQTIGLSDKQDGKFYEQRKPVHAFGQGSVLKTPTIGKLLTTFPHRVQGLNHRPQT